MMDIRRTVYRCDDIEIDVQNLRVTVRSEIRPLEPKSFRLLLFLVENPGRILTKSDIMAAIWPDAAVSDNSLARAITQIRKAIGDDSKAPRYIETVPTIGYRCIADCTQTENDRTPPVPIPIPVRSDRRLLLVVALTGLCVLAVAASFAARFIFRPAPQSTLRVLSATRLTSYPGDEREPAVSPDGSLVAFSWSGPSADNYDIYILRPGGDQPLRLTHDPAPDGFPAWSPDGGKIAFIRRTEGRAQLILVPALGGPERVLHQFPRMGADLDFSQHPIITWSQDGASLLYSGLAGNDEKYRLFVISVDTGETRPITTPGPNEIGDSSPAVSPDGRLLAFVRYVGPRNGRLMIQQLSSGIVPVGEPRAVQSSAPSPRSPIWLQDSHRLLFADQMGLFQWDPDHGATQIYASDGTLTSASLSSAHAGDLQLTVAITHDDPDIWETPLNPQGSKATGPPVVVQQSTANDSHPDLSPDGRFMTFVSLRSGSMEVWLADADGHNPRQLTHLGAHIASYPRWSPDGTRIAFHARVPDVAQVYVIDVREGTLRQVTHQNPGLALATWSNDGHFLYASTLVGSHGTLYRLPAEGGTPERLWSGSLLKESLDGQYALYWKPDQVGIFRRSLQGDPRNNPEERIVPDFWPANQLGGYEPVAEGIYYVSGDAKGKSGPFRFFSYATRKSVDVAPPAPGLAKGFTITPDHRHLAFAASAQVGGDLMVLHLQ